MNQAVDIYHQPLDTRRMLAPLGAIDAAGQEDRVDFSALLTMLRRNLGVFFSIFTATILIAIMITINQPVRYSSTSQIVIDLQSAQIAPRQDTVSAMIQSPSDQVDTEVKVLMSRDLAERVVTALDLVADPHFNPALAPVPDGIAARVKRTFGLDDPEAPLSASEARRRIVDTLLTGLQITRAGDSFAVDITATASSPESARDIANEVARQYITSRVRTKLDDNQTATTFLSGKLEELRHQAHADMEQVQRYRVAHNLLSTSGASLTEQEISSYNQAVATARAEASEDVARLNTARAQLRSGSSGDDVGEALGSSVVSQLRTRQAEVSGRLATLQARYNDAHPDVQRARSEFADINAQIQAEIRRVISNLEAKAQVSGERLASLTGSLSSAKSKLAENNQAMTDLDDLERRANASQEVYESYLSRYKQVSTEAGVGPPGAHLISPAELPLRPASPNIKLNLLLGTLVGLGLGCAGAFIAECLFAGLTSGEEVEARLGMRYLAGVPTFAGHGSRRDDVDGLAPNPRSAFTEGFRTLKASLISRSNGAPQLIMITSSLPREGKTTTAACLARLLARSGERVVLVDCDRRLARVSRELTETRKLGLLEVLDGSAALDDVLVQDRVTDLMILPQSEVADPREDLLGGEATVQLLQELRQRFTWIILDTPPALAIAETRILAGLADAVVVVVRWRHTPHHAVRATLRLFAGTGVRVAGAVLTQIDLARQGRLTKGDASSYYKRYRAYYS